MELVQTGLGAIVGELDLEFHLVPSHGPATNRTLSAHTGASPRAVRCAIGKFPTVDRYPGSFAEGVVVHGWTPYAAPETNLGATDRRVKPNARGSGARRANTGDPMEGNLESTMTRVRLGRHTVGYEQYFSQLDGRRARR